MTVDCCICTELLLKAGTRIAAAPCGHVYHAECLKSWVEKQNNKGICPLCSANFHPSKIIPLHSLDDIQSKSIESIYGFVKNIESKSDDSKQVMELVGRLRNEVSELKERNATLDKIIAHQQISFFKSGNTNDFEKLTALVDELRKENSELKKKVFSYETNKFVASKQLREFKQRLQNIIVEIDEIVNLIDTSAIETQKQFTEIRCLVMELANIIANTVPNSMMARLADSLFEHLPYTH